MSCTGCELFDADIAESATLYLVAPLAHTVAKLRKCLAGRVRGSCETIDGVLRIPLRDDSTATILDTIAGTLSNPELRACRAVLLPEGESFGLQHIGAIQPLHKLVARSETGWLYDLLQRQGGMHSIFQPIVHAARPEQVFAYECLVRGRLDDGRILTAGEILSAARDADLLFHVDREARLTAIRDAGLQGISTPLFINFNPTAIYDPQFCLRTTVAAARATGVPGDRFVFEVIESDAVDDVDHLLRILRYYRDAGFRVALDDLGSGYASLNLLAQLRPDFVKFDRELIRAIDRDDYKQKVVRKLIELALELGIGTVAEGIERIEEWRWLRDAGIDYAQGYLFARPGSPPPSPTPLV